MLCDFYEEKKEHQPLYCYQIFISISLKNPILVGLQNFWIVTKVQEQHLPLPYYLH